MNSEREKVMKKQYIQPQTEAQNLQGMHVVCSSAPGEIHTSPTPTDPNNVEIF